MQAALQEASRADVKLMLDGFTLDEATLVGLADAAVCGDVGDGDRRPRDQPRSSSPRIAAKYETTQLRQAAAARICSLLSQSTPALMVRPMSEIVERSCLDLRYEAYRLRNAAAEARLLASIAERGIEEPLGGVDTPQGRLLLDGFRRNRCAAKLGIECVPYVSWGEDETQGIASLLSARRQRTLSILEQARFVDELLSTHELTMADVAEMLSRSKAWVSTRHNLLGQMTPEIQGILFRGAFPVYSYMVTLLQAMQNVMTGCDSPRLQSRGFYAQANLLLASLLGRRESFFKKMEEFYDRSGQA